MVATTFDDRQDPELRIFLGRMRRLCMPSRRGAKSEKRREDRHICMVPVLVCPWRDGAPVQSERQIAVAKDLSNHGVGLLLSKPFPHGKVVVGVYVDPEVSSQPWFFLGETCHLTDLGGGCRTLGITVTECANAKFADELEVLKPLMECLRPFDGNTLESDSTDARIESPEPASYQEPAAKNILAIVVLMGLAAILAAWGFLLPA